MKLREINNLVRAAFMGLCMFATAAVADTGLFFAQDRDGEGFSITEQGDGLAFLFFTYAKGPLDERPRLPTVSPAPPPPVVPNLDTPLWIMGNSTEGFGGEGFWAGELRYATYCEDCEGQIARFRVIGTFEVMRDGDGYVIDLEYVPNPFFGPTAPLYETNYYVQKLTD